MLRLGTPVGLAVPPLRVVVRSLFVIKHIPTCYGNDLEQIANRSSLLPS